MLALLSRDCENSPDEGRRAAQLRELLRGAGATQRLSEPQRGT
jgi:hypothetical protein